MRQLQRILEVELMDTSEEATGYDQMDHAVVNSRFVSDFLAEHGTSRGGWYLDVGTGTGLIPLILAVADRNAKIEAVDGAHEMLKLASEHVASAGLTQRIRLIHGDAKNLSLPSGKYEAVLSNSIVHHIPEPLTVMQEMVRLVAPGGTLFVRDLSRPVDAGRLQTLVNRYADGAPEIARRMFAESLHAALTPNEVADLVEPMGIPRACVALTSDRHWTLVWKRPPE